MSIVQNKRKHPAVAKAKKKALTRAKKPFGSKAVGKKNIDKAVRKANEADGSFVNSLSRKFDGAGAKQNVDLVKERAVAKRKKDAKGSPTTKRKLVKKIGKYPTDTVGGKTRTRKSILDAVAPNSKTAKKKKKLDKGLASLERKAKLKKAMAKRKIATAKAKAKKK